MSAARAPARMSAWILLPGFLVVLVFATALLSPLLLGALHAAGATGAGLEKVTLRTLELTAIALTFVLLALLGGGGRRAWGVPPRQGLWSTLGRGLLLGIASLLPVCAVLYVLDVRVLRPGLEPDLAWWLTVVAKAGLSAVAVGLLEEFWFRGGLFTVLERCWGATLALLLGAAIYAGAHFLDAPDDLAAGSGAVMHTLSILGHALSAVFRTENLDSFTALLVAGIALGVVRQRSGHIALAIGIHAGWVLTIKVFKKYTVIDPQGPYRFLAGRYDDFIGWAAVASLGLLLLWLWWRLEPAAEPA